ncbi:FitA-like ribbon-helix-helix domain-containing protein [Nocardia camponoti]|uniref:Antitoxin VapB1 n=1 Tax=Nocardia camponoti TaxID=1616106 RepID=A0A917QJG6_9NOCA|nr:antitoxin [Nocardia camponoti]GGK52785.1 putative antitoxin VapB1 [Nocardia camponoti]
MATIQIRDIPEEDAEVLRRRAEAAGMSLQAYVRRGLIAAARRPTKDEATRAIREALGKPTPGATNESILEALDAARCD